MLGQCLLNYQGQLRRRVTLGRKVPQRLDEQGLDIKLPTRAKHDDAAPSDVAEPLLSRSSGVQLAVAINEANHIHSVLLECLVGRRGHMMANAAAQPRGKARRLQLLVRRQIDYEQEWHSEPTSGVDD